MPQEVTELSVGILMKSAANEGHNKSTCDCHLQHSKGENEVELSIQPVCLVFMSHVRYNTDINTKFFSVIL